MPFLAYKDNVHGYSVKVAPGASPPAMPNGQQSFTGAGTTSWTVPANVTSISAVVIGGGGAGLSSAQSGAGGSGGDLRYINDLVVTPGEVLTVVVGNGGSPTQPATPGGETYISRGGTRLISAAGGGEGTTFGPNPQNGTSTAIGGSVGGGNGGSGGYASGTAGAGGGGGAGGYYGDGGAGGDGGTNYTNGSFSPGQGGGGGGGVRSEGGSAGGGGGTGILGNLNNENGQGGARGNSVGYGGTGGSGGTAGGAGANGNGGNYGGGGGGTDTLSFVGYGTAGAARIIYGTNRAYPATNTADM